MGEIKESTRGFVSLISLLFVHRPLNAAAHLCAENATSVGHGSLWLNFAPDFIYTCLNFMIVILQSRRNEMTC